MTKRASQATNRKSRRSARLLLLSASALLVLYSLGSLLSFTLSTQSVTFHSGYWDSALQLAHLRSSRPDTLVVYTYSNSNSEHERNLEFFVRHGVRAGDGCEYIITIQHGLGLPLSDELPLLPKNGRYLHHENLCFDWGTVNWLIETKQIDIANFRYFVFMNSSVRGPFLPAFWPAGLRWSQALTAKITSTVKLVGPTISCEPASPPAGTAASKEARSIHVQGYVIATDQVGLRVLQEDGNVLKCHTSAEEAAWHSEVGATSAILRAGFNLDCLVLRYAGVDWRDDSFAKCNAGKSPLKERSLDGMSVHPLEVMFVRVESHLLALEWSSATSAVAIDRWMHQKRDSVAVTSNAYDELLPELKRERSMAMALRGAGCFDVAYYKEINADLPKMDDRQLWEHFVIEGQFEARPFRFRCPKGGSNNGGGSGGSLRNIGLRKGLEGPVTPDSLVAGALRAAQGLLLMMGKPMELAQRAAEMEKVQTRETALDRSVMA